MDHLPCAVLKTSRDRVILFANTYFAEHFDWDLDEISGKNLASIFSRASQLFCDSYVYPTALAHQICKEMQLTVVTSSGERRPVVASVTHLESGEYIWAMIEANNRHDLFQELQYSRDALQEKKEQFERLSCMDALTGVLNRRGFDEGIKGIFADADRNGQPVAVLLLDIDHFKQINDANGHQVGDDALTALAMTLKNVCRKNDLIGRFGGDEFACVLPHTDTVASEALCARLHTAIANHSGPLAGITISIGVSARSAERPIAWTRALSEADKALYRAKASGRNTTVISSEHS